MNGKGLGVGEYIHCARCNLDTFIICMFMTDFHNNLRITWLNCNGVSYESFFILLRKINCLDLGLNFLFDYKI